MDKQDQQIVEIKQKDIKKRSNEKKKEKTKNIASFRESQRLPSDPKQRKKEAKIRKLGNTIRIAMFILNAAVWLAGLLALIGGLMVGLSNGTFSIDAEEDDYYEGGEIRWGDFVYTTPATLLVYYGILMLIAAMFGCFAAAGGRKGCNIAYAVGLVFLLLFDFVFGIIVYWDPFAMQNFIQRMNDSMDSYGKADGETIGVIPILVSDYWDYLQHTGGCCGLFKYTDWRNKTIGQQFSMPDSCCTKDYDYKNCGFRIWKHLENEVPFHHLSEVAKQVGCVTIFPEELTTEYVEVAAVTIILGIFIVTCLVLCIVILFLIFFKKYRQTRGPQNIPKLITPEDPYELDAPGIPVDSRKSGGNNAITHQDYQRQLSPATDSGFEERVTPPTHSLRDNNRQSMDNPNRLNRIGSYKSADNIGYRSGYPQHRESETFYQPQPLRLSQDSVRRNTIDSHKSTDNLLPRSEYRQESQEFHHPQEVSGGSRYLAQDNNLPNARQEEYVGPNQDRRNTIDSYRSTEGFRLEPEIPNHESQIFHVQHQPQVLTRIPVANPGIRRNSYNVYTFLQDQDDINQNLVKVFQNQSMKKFPIPIEYTTSFGKGKFGPPTSDSESSTFPDFLSNSSHIAQPHNKKSNSLLQIYFNRIGRIPSRNVGSIPTKKPNKTLRNIPKGHKPSKVHPIPFTKAEPEPKNNLHRKTRKELGEKPRNK